MTMSSDMGATSEPEQWVRLAGESHDGSIEQFEVVAARRALALLKGKLGRERLLDLLQEEIAAGSAFLREQVARSAGQETTGTTTLLAHGITAAQFTGWLSHAFGREDVLLAGHPEHYSIHAAGGRVNIVETLGEHVCSFLTREWDESAIPGAELPMPEEKAAHGRRSLLALEDGTVVGSISNLFSEEEDGFTAHLSVTLPVTCGPPVIEHHLQHFAVEFRNWILRAAAEVRPGLAPRPGPLRADRSEAAGRPLGKSVRIPSAAGVVGVGRAHFAPPSSTSQPLGPV
jgi:hypothetical protein